MPPKKGYCFTLNNYTEDEFSAIARVCESESQYAIVGREVGASGTPHLQGYILFKRSYRFQTIKDRYLPRCHIEVAAGNAQSNRTYCSKDGDFVEYGDIPSSAEGGSNRDEIARAFRDALGRGHAGLDEFATANPGSWYYSGHNLLRNHLTLQRAIERPDIHVEWYYGRPGAGKSREAHEKFPEAYVKDPRTKWWNGYLLEKEVIIDDYGIQCVDINHLLRWFDRYKCYIESKGGMMPLYADKFVVTSNFHPSQLFRSNVFRFSGSVSVQEEELHPQYEALMRRIILKEFIYIWYICENMHPLLFLVGVALPLEKGARCSARLFLVCQQLVAFLGLDFRIDRARSASKGSAATVSNFRYVCIRALGF